MYSGFLSNVQSEYRITVEGITLHLQLDHIAPVAHDEATGNSDLIMMTNHTHALTEIFFCHTKQLLLAANEKILSLMPGDIVIIPPGIPHHALSARESGGWGSFFCSCTFRTQKKDHYLKQLLEPFFHGTHIYCLNKQPDLSDRLWSMLNSSEDNPLSPMLDLLQTLIKIANLIQPSSDQTGLAAEQSEQDRLYRLDHIVNTEFMKNLTAEDVASALYISVRQLARVTQKRYGASFHRVITERRITTAEQMLRSTSMSAEKIALAVGFSSKASFWREFERKYHISPAKYRRTFSQTALSGTTEHPS